MNGSSIVGRRITLTVAGVVALASAIVVLAVVGTREGHAAGEHGHAAPTRLSTQKAVAFHDAMRALWEAHGAWTHMVIVSFAGNLPDLGAEEQVLLQNQVDIGDAVKPYYGAAAGTQLTRLLKAHILGAVKVLEAAKAGDSNRLAQAEAAWSVNGRQIADFLHAADPRFLSRAAARQMMAVHLKQVIEQAADELTGHYAAGARAFAPYIRHILDMADMISGGIIQQFPGRFRCPHGIIRHLAGCAGERPRARPRAARPPARPRAPPKSLSQGRGERPQRICRREQVSRLRARQPSQPHAQELAPRGLALAPDRLCPVGRGQPRDPAVALIRPSMEQPASD